ncbi:MAG: DUF349 domain-containing protein [Lachnoclostridium sp.]|nr:DUF349 domain-containing protein [Lachnoclostridium sp.]
MEMRDSSLEKDNNLQDVTLNESAEADTLKNVTNETEIVTEPDVVSVEAESSVPESSDADTCANVLAQIEAFATKDASEISNDEVSRLKQHFYLLKSASTKQVDADEDAEKEQSAYIESEDATYDNRLKAALETIKEKKAQLRASIEAEQQRNYELKLDLVAQLTALSEDTDNVNRSVAEAREIQTKFKEIGEVPPAVSSELWKKYQDACEKFYDHLKINKELRDYDFKKNLSEKELLIEEATKLLSEPDVVTAFRRLQTLHEKWREIGPVMKELREEIWARFKDISAQINKAYQTYFEERKAREQANEAAKTEICERLEALDYSNLTKFTEWDAMTKQILQAQEDWKKIGFASRKNNNALFARFRESCDKFFEAKAAFFKKMKETFATNLEKKIALCERAEALKDSTDWRKASDEFIKMQQEWRTIGAVSKRQSDVVWQRFLSACDYFFEQKKKNGNGTRKLEHENLEKKRQVIEDMKALESQQLDRSAMLKAIREQQVKWQEIGHVPFAEKDKIYKEYREVADRLYDSLGSRETRKRMESFETTISNIGSDENKLYRERDRLVRIAEQKKSELTTYENNLLFFNTKSKTGESMLRELNRKIQRIKDDIEDLENKIKLIDSKL